MKQKELKQSVCEMSVEALIEEQQALLKEQFGLKIQRATGQMTKTHRMREIRRCLARIKTLMAAKMQLAGDKL